MSAETSWLASRRPAPPEALAGRIRDTEDLAGPALVERLVSEALEALGRARARPGRVRDAALDLLLADALLTYACEAALELPDGREALERLVERAAEAG